MGVGGFARLWSDVDLFSASLEDFGTAKNSVLSVCRREGGLEGRGRIGVHEQGVCRREGGLEV